MSLDTFITSLVDTGKIKVTKDGRVWAYRGGRLQELPARERGDGGYLAVDLRDGNETRTAYVHRVVYIAAHGSIPDTYEIDHIDRNRHNNSLVNLRAVHKSDNGLNRDQGGQNNPTAKLTWTEVREIRRLYGSGPSQRDLAKNYGVSPTTIRTIVKKQAWWPDPGEAEESLVGVLDVSPDPESTSDKLDNTSSTPGILETAPLSDAEFMAQWEQEQAKLLWEGTKLDQQPERYEEAKAAYAATYGNASRAARLVGLHPDTLRQYAARDNWPTTPTPSGVAKTSAEKATRSRIQHMADLLEAKLYSTIDSLVIEDKQRADIADKGLMSEYVAPLSQRSNAFKTIFDAWMRLKTILEPEQFGYDDARNNPHAARLQRQKELMGGVEGVERQLASFFAGINLAAGASREPVAFVDAEIVSSGEGGFLELDPKTGVDQGTEH